ncbi:hypothetical protein GLOTRDRAFT_72827 [Gloeophyllum trabeum ATCC 11539]|uniref:RING-type domain-containing protein n=1 Tax=Gloeophyllum trabeum (strain ATCC 11539 / FP-39264 / Madison 617) TaxID=670483 RepID=S7QG74_GLOTA|nr:uncharacterized protein GLOTRDRAFT_72827 [Gloeophyllum trabeum ATCC 11539]EPQ58422.1 hypothetical protein GLOTRDRAFT_72827 [Gloeophyllum trabeum ATCC 11539]
MGNTGSSAGRGQHDETVDFGYLVPQGVYTGPRDWNHAIVTQLIVDRKLAPFYRPLEDYDESWDDETLLAHRKELPDSDSAQADTPTRAESIAGSTHSKLGHHKRPSAAKEPQRFSEGAIYRGAVECPICFLYYPPNINYSRCCEQAICTECFVQIKRADPTPTHLVSEPAACPYCMQENFGVVYTPPSWRAGIGSEGSTPPSWPDSAGGSSQPTSPMPPTMKRRRKSFGADSPDVVTTDQIRPDWEAKLAAVRAAVARRANRRIIMRQVGDRLIPVGITSGRIHPLPEGEQGEAEGSTEGRGSRRSRRRQQNPDLNQFLGSIPIGGQDLEELMVMEAMRLSLLEHEEQQRKQREEEERRQAQAGESSSQAEQNSTEAAIPSPADPETVQSTPATALTPAPSSSLDPGPTDRSATPSGLEAGVASTSSRPSPVPSNHSGDISTPAVGPSGDSAMLDAPEAPPSIPHTASFASSLAPGETPGRAESYDVLPSSPDEESSAAEPLLASPSPQPPSAVQEPSH